MSVTEYDEVKICNAVLATLGENPINSIESPTTDVEATCAELFPLVLNSLLAKHEWNFANPVRKLAADDGKSEEFKSGYRYAYRLPSNLIAGPFAVYADNQRTRPTSDFTIVENYILMNSEVCWAKFRARPAISEMPIYFIDLVVLALTSRGAKPIADNSELATEYRIQAFGAANEGGKGGAFGIARDLDVQSTPIRSMFQNGNPLIATRR